MLLFTPKPSTRSVVSVGLAPSGVITTPAMRGLLVHAPLP